MDVDLRNRGIARLCFDAEETSEEEATVASAVAVLLADHNLIDCVRGLDAVFVHLVELRLSHNRLGQQSTAYYQVRHDRLPSLSDLSSYSPASCCDGVPSWIRCLPSTVEVLDVSFNHLRSFLQCSCDGSSSAATEDGAALKAPSTPHRSSSDAAEGVMRVLRHCCPFALPLFFPAAQFPQLRELNVSHNALDVSLRESDEMQARLAAALHASSIEALPSIGPAAGSAVDLSYNHGLAALNCFFAGLTADTAASVCSVSLVGTGLEDLQGLSAIDGAAARWQLQLHPSPVSRVILSAAPAALLELTPAIVAAGLGGEHDALAVALMGADGCGDGAAATAIDRLDSVDQLKELEAIVERAVAQGESTLLAAKPDGATLVSTLMYVCLLRQVVPSLDTVDTALAAGRCERLLLSALCQLLLGDPQPPRAAPSRLLPMPAPPPLHPSAPATVASPPAPSAPAPSGSTLPPPMRGLGEAAHAVAPELRSRVVVEESTAAADAGEAPGTARPGRFQAALAALRPSRSSSAAAPAGAATRTPSCHSTLTASSVCATEASANSDGAASTPAGLSREEWFTPAGLAREEGTVYESLCREAAELQESVLASKERCREARTQSEALQRQLTQDRTLVADQLKEVGRLRDEKERLEASVGRAKLRLEKRQKDVTYGVAAMQSREAATREKLAMERIAAREKELARRERQLRQRAARTGALAVEYHSSGPSAQRKKLRSEVLREAAVRRRLAEQENRDPLAYTPAPFKAETRRSSPRTSPDPCPSSCAVAEEERAYFDLYGDRGATGLREAADQYVAHLAPAQQQQLREASLRLPASGSRDNSASPSRRTPSSRRRSSPTADGRVAAAYDAQGPAAAAAPPEGGRDLSSLSLSELLDAAAAIRQKQLALQQLQQQWRRPLPPPPPMLSPGGGEEATCAAAEGLSGAALAERTPSAGDGVGERAGSTHSPFSPSAHGGDASSRRPSPLSSAQQLFDLTLEQRAASAARLSAASLKAVSHGGGSMARTATPSYGGARDEDATNDLTSDAAVPFLQTNRALFN